MAREKSLSTKIDNSCQFLLTRKICIFILLPVINVIILPNFRFLQPRVRLTKLGIPCVIPIATQES